MAVTIGALNCRGLSEEVKRRDIFDRCNKKYDITILCDTHCTKERENKWRNEWGYQAYFCSFTGHSRGVAILLNNKFKVIVHKEYKHKEGNYLILDMTIHEYRITLADIYGPNNDNPGFFTEVQEVISNIQNSSIIMAGDWNVVQDYEIDTLNYKTKNNVKAHTKLIEIKNSLDLVDVWRANNPDKKRYTWRGPEHKQSRLDYFLISTDFESLVNKSDIDISYRSDHSPVSLSLKFYNQERGRGTWKFNNSLLHDTYYVAEIKKCISDTVNQYNLSNTGEETELSVKPQLFWELLKCTIRGKTISYTSYLKKKSKGRI
ncbi:Hypothetical predicted protein [Mytilus galloprovincialis]|uniref:exodeoxyribonuclease III n=1 Tax=Mytilus galloprovincialis TaxID=29158 RepID=A0A8B6F0S0_MYTGA|nr:Hypothetical predicted protein [Mytilus galloprovincialis]